MKETHQQTNAVSYEDALTKARQLKSQINHCIEFTNAYVFSYSTGEHTVGGDSPLVIMKDTGEALNFIVYAITPDKEIIQQFDITE